MSTYQIYIFVCEGCGKIVTETKEDGLYSDPVITLPEGEPEWEYVGEKLLCGECYESRVK